MLDRASGDENSWHVTSEKCRAREGRTCVAQRAF